MTSRRQHSTRQQYDLSKQLQDGFRLLVRSAAAMNVFLLLLSLVTAYVIVMVVVTSSLTKEAKDQARHMVDAMVTAIEGFVPPGTVIGPGMDSAAQEDIKRMIRNARYDDPNGYFILFHIYGTVIAQGIDQKFEGTNRRDARDADGVFYIQRLIEAAQQGGGFVRYRWPKLDGGEPLPKISYAKLLRGGEWWIASGVYLDSVDEVIGDIRTTQGLYLLGLAGVLFLFLSIGYRFGNVLGENIAQPVAEQMKGLARMADETRRVHAGVLHNLVGRVTVVVKHKLSEMAQTVDATTRQRLKQEASVVINDFDKHCQKLEDDIYPLVVQHHGLGAMTQLVEEETDGREVPHVTPAIDEAVPRSDNGRECAVYLVAQGLLQNVLKSAQATQVRMALVYEAEQVTLTVEDNGRGFDADAVLKQPLSAKSRYGIPWMVAEVKVYGGALTIHSEPGRGTTARVTMPWPPRSETNHGM